MTENEARLTALWRRHFRPYWLFPALLALLTGCSTVKPYRAYPDKTLPKDQVAKIVPETMGGGILVSMNRTVVIERVDGKRTYGWWYPRNDVMPLRDVYVLPGKHTIGLKFQSGSLYARGDLWFVAEAGKSYFVTAGTKGYEVHFMIKDVDGKPVGGISGSEDEPR